MNRQVGIRLVDANPGSEDKYFDDGIDAFVNVRVPACVKRFRSARARTCMIQFFKSGGVISTQPKLI